MLEEELMSSTKRWDRTCKMLFIAFSAENWRIIYLAYYVLLIFWKPTKLQTPEFLNVRTPWLSVFEIYNLSEPIIWRKILLLPDILYPKTREVWDFLFVRSQQMVKLLVLGPVRGAPQRGVQTWNSLPKLQLSLKSAQLMTGLKSQLTPSASTRFAVSLLW